MKLLFQDSRQQLQSVLPCKLSQMLHARHSMKKSWSHDEPIAAAVDAS
jgi:hypothetical protein